MAQKYICETFDSIDRMLATINSRPNNSVMANENDSHDGSSGFTGTANYGEAETLIKNGWEKPLSELRDAMRAANVKTNVTHSKTRPTTGIVGYVPCVPNAIKGLPNSMIMTERTPSKVKAVTIIYNSSAAARTKTEEFFRSGASMLKIINNLELSGYRVRLVLEYMCARSGNEDALGRVVLKDWRQHIDLKKLSFPLANSSMLRRFGFRWLETQPDITESGFNGDYGTAIGNVDSYDKVVKDYRAGGVLSDNEYFINMQMCKDEGQDVERIMARAGMKMKI
jgi:hypothetical protein